MKKIALLFFPFLIVGCTKIVPPTINDNLIGIKNSVYSSGSEITWKGYNSIKNIHDGDTLTTKTNKKIRLLGIDTPEMSHSTKWGWEKSYSLELFWATKARDFVRNLLRNKNVTVIFNGYKTYGRHVGEVFYKDQNQKVINLSFELLRQGLARRAYITYKPGKFHVPKKYYEYVLRLEEKAKYLQKGFWKYNLIQLKNIFPKWDITN
ncbi:MAG: hypothetical protein GY679_03750 [Mycoplasma sp.]|nr:hypothetical protein [Mycoplasma sp.]